MTPAAAWAAVVAGEDAAIYAYSVAGVRTGAPDRARAALADHRAHRDRAAALAQATGGARPTPAPAYALGPVSSEEDAQAVLAHVENALAPVYADAAAATAGEERRWAVRAGIACAVRAVRWGAAPQAFPSAAVSD